VEDAADLDPSAGFTAAAWVQLDGYPATNLAAIFAKPFTAGDDTFVLAVSSDMNATFDSEDGSGTTDSFEGDVLPLGEWHHVAFVWTGADKLGYLDGKLVASHAVGVGFDATSPLFVGADDIPAGFFLDGTIDDVVFYTRPLSATEITQLATP
jgi:hypothetical protein